jgi:hypothetical protein
MEDLGSPFPAGRRREEKANREAEELCGGEASGRKTETLVEARASRVNGRKDRARGRPLDEALLCQRGQLVTQTQVVDAELVAEAGA